MRKRATKEIKSKKKKFASLQELQAAANQDSAAFELTDSMDTEVRDVCVCMYVCVCVSCVCIGVYVCECVWCLVCLFLWWLSVGIHVLKNMPLNYRLARVKKSSRPSCGRCKQGRDKVVVVCRLLLLSS